MSIIRVIRLRRRSCKRSWGFTIRHTLILPINNAEHDQCTTNDNERQTTKRDPDMDRGPQPSNGQMVNSTTSSISSSLPDLHKTNENIAHTASTSGMSKLP